jgi:signal transduction histidine kinase
MFTPANITENPQELSEHQQKQIKASIKWLHDNGSAIGNISLMIDVVAEEKDLLRPEILELKSICQKTSDLVLNIFNQTQGKPHDNDLFTHLTTFKEDIRQDIIEIIASVDKNCHFLDESFKEGVRSNLFPQEAELNPEYLDSTEISNIVSGLKLLYCQGLNVTLDYDQMSVFADKASFIRILQNILNNTRKYTPVGTNVKIEIKRLNQATLLIVEDDGPGFKGNPQDLVKMYVQDKQEHAEKGHGIGLSYCHDVVQDHGGTMELFNVADLPGKKGTGAMFVIILPDSSPRQSQVIFKNKESPARKVF